MLQPLVPIIALVAAAAWIVALVSLVRVVLIVPRGQRLSAIFSSGFWQFEKVRAIGGAAVDVHLQRFVWAFVVFFFAMIAAIFLGMMLTLEAQQAAQVPA